MNLNIKISQAREIIKEAIDRYNPIAYVALYSGGHDSAVSSHVSLTILKEMGIRAKVYHGDTTIGIKETQEHVIKTSTLLDWDLEIRKPPKWQDRYLNIVREYGFPGATKSSHQFMYRRLKERAIKSFVTNELKSKPKARENVLLLSGVRKSESVIRMGYTDPVQKDDSRIWCNPIFYWTEEDCSEYMELVKLPPNPVKLLLCISGECLCGSFARKEEYSEIKEAYPDAAAQIDFIYEVAKAHGHPWPWGMGPNDWNKAHPPGQTDMFMCVGCEEKRQINGKN